MVPIGGLYVQPQIACVTYLSNSGAPTLVCAWPLLVPAMLLLFPPTLAGVSIRYDGASRLTASGLAKVAPFTPHGALPLKKAGDGDIEVVYPRKAKTMCFDGRLLHGELRHCRMLTSA